MNGIEVILYILMPALITIAVSLCFILGSETDDAIGKFLIILGTAITSFFVNQGIHHMVDSSKKADSYNVTIEKEDVTENYHVTSYSIDGDTVKLVFEGGNVEYYVLKKGEKVKCQH